MKPIRQQHSGIFSSIHLFCSVLLLLMNVILLLGLTPATGYSLSANNKNQRQQQQTTATTSSLSIPDAGPSWKYLALGRQVTIKSADWCNQGKMLPFQHYKCRSPKKSMTENVVANNKISSLESILKQIENSNNNVNNATTLTSHNLHLSKSSIYQLEQYASDPTRVSVKQKSALIQKIQVEQHASRPLDPNQVLQILYCDEHIIVVNKPSGVLSVPGARRNPSLANVIYDTVQPTLIDTVDQMVVHRLDMATSGVLVYALSKEALSKLHRDFKNRKVQKTYQALVHSDNHEIVVTEGEIHVALERDPDNPPFMRTAQPKDIGDLTTSNGDGGNNAMKIGPDHKFYKQSPKESLTTWSVLSKETIMASGDDDRRTEVARLELRPWTGRTHQLRVHCSQVLKAPIIGDTIYGGNPDVTSSLCLHAEKLCIYHPISGAPMIFEAAPPF